MSQRLEQLLEQLDRIEPRGKKQKAMLGVLQGTGLSFLAAAKGGGTWTDEARRELVSSDERVETAAGMLGERYEGVIILRKMMAIAMAIIDGEPEPTDAKLDEQFGQPKSAGCLSVVLAVGAVVLLLLVFAGCNRKPANDPHRQAIETRVKKIVGEQFGLDPSILKLTDRFREDFKADDLDTVELTMEFEDAFNLRIPDEAALKMATIKDAVDYIERHHKSR